MTESHVDHDVPTPDDLAEAAAVRLEALKGKRRLTSSVLGMEVIVFWLAIIEAVVQSHISHPVAFGVGGGLALACIVVAARITRPWAYPAGSVLQVLAIASGVAVHTMFFIGALFAVLWVVALRMGDTAMRKADAYAVTLERPRQAE